MSKLMNISGIDCYEKDGVAYLKLETCARGLGFTEKAASGNETIRWRTVRQHLENLGIAASCDGKLPDFIPENIFYRLAMKAKNEVAETFQAKIADEVIPSIRRTGGYIADQAMLVKPVEVSPGGLAKLISITRRVMLDMGSTPQDVGAAMQNIYRTWGVPAPELHNSVISEQLNFSDFSALQAS